MISREKELGLVRDVLKESPRGLTVSDVAEKLHMSRNSSAKYLEMLLISGQVDMRTFGRSKIFSLSRRMPMATALGLSSEMIVFIDESLQVVEANEQFIKFSDAPRVKVIGQSIESTSLPLLLHRDILLNIRDALRGREFVREIGVSKGPVEYYFKVKIIPAVADGRQIAAIIFENITDRKHAELALKDSEARYRMLIENAPLGIFTFDMQGNMTSFNEKILELVGSKSPNFTRSVNLFNFEPLVRSGLTTGVYDRLIKGESMVSEGRYTSYWGKTVFLRLLLKPLRDSTGNISGTLGIVEDITDRKRAEAALVRDRHILIKSQEVAKVGNWAWDLKTGEFSGSAENYWIWGYEPGEARPTRDRVLSSVMPEDRAALADFMDKEARDGMRGSIDYRIRKPDGSFRYVNSIVDKAVRDTAGNVKRLYGITQDITERKRAEEALRNSERKFRAIFDQTLQFTGLLATDGTLLEANNAALAYIGAAESDVIGKPFWDTPWWTHSPEMQAQVHKAVKKAANGSLDRFEATLRASDGRLFYFDFSLKPVVSEDGRVVLLIPEARDITERKQVEEELKEAKQQAELYLDLMGHDINNMHQIALGYLEIADGMMPEDDSRREFLETPAEVLQRSAQLIKNVRKLQKLQEGAFKTQEIDVCEVLVDVQREFGAVPHKAITLNLNGCGQCHVRANELLHDVFSNLVSNAIKHTGDRADIDIGLSVVYDNDTRYCRVIVEDNGPGIPDDFKQQVFHRMLKGTDKAKGMGLGLYLVKSLVDSYSGKVWVEDRVKGDYMKGARFVVLLPAVEK